VRAGSAGRPAFVDAYSGAAVEWAAGPDRLYRPLGAALVDALVDALVGGGAGAGGRGIAGARVLDVGAGTGAVSAALVSAGADVVALDLAHGMLAHDRARRPPAVVGDVLALPVRPGRFAAVTAGCCLGHLPDPVRALVGLAAAVRPDGYVAASAFSTAWRDPMKAAVDDALVRHGYRPPDWYRTFKDGTEAATGSVGALRGIAAAAGLTAEVREVAVPVAFPDAAAVVEWRLGMAHVAPFVAGLEPGHRLALRRDAAGGVEAVAGGVAAVTVVVPLLVLLARAD
jgi:SAM-dependent methyltransferase